MKKLLLVSFLWQSTATGGATVVVNQLADYLKNSFDVSVLTSTLQPRAYCEEANRIKIIYLPNRNLYWIGDQDRQPGWKKVLFQLLDTWNPLMYSAIKQAIHEQAPDIIHIHKLRGLSPAVWSAAAACGVPQIIHTCHDYELISPHATFYGLAGRLAHQRSPLIRPYQAVRARLSRSVNAVSAPSRFTLDIHNRAGFFKNARRQVIPNSHGYSLDRLASIRSDLSSRLPTKGKFLFIGRLDLNKGILELCDAFNRITPKFPQAELHIIGWGYLEEMLRKISSEHLNIHYHGPLYGEQKEKYLSECTALIGPTLGFETFGLVIPEAFAFGKPVIAARIGGIPEIVKEGVTGWLIPAGDIDQLQNAIENVLDNPSQVESLRPACFEEAQRYTPETVFQQYVYFYGSD